jgi:NADPH:quinone reductase-like Zn-dependent oxidoreductase
VHGFNLIQLLQRGSIETRRYLADIMHKVFLLYKEGKIKPVVDSVFTFDEVNIRLTRLISIEFSRFSKINNALGKLIDRQNIGKVVIEPFLSGKTEQVKKVNNLI